MTSTTPHVGLSQRLVRILRRLHSFACCINATAWQVRLPSNNPDEERAVVWPDQGRKDFRADEIPLPALRHSRIQTIIDPGSRLPHA